MLQKNLPFLRALWVISARMWFDLAALIHFMVKGKFRDAWAVSRAHQRFFLDLFKTARKRTREGHRARLQGWYRGSFIWAFYVHGKHAFSKLDPRRFL